jgi:quercetin dioxygenase-like cupin family protein
MENKDTQTIVGHVKSLAGMTAYQEGAVISREIIKKDTGTVTIFAFDKGQGLSEHTAPFDALVNVLDGKAEIVISGNPNQLKAEILLLCPQMNLIH